MSVKLYLGCAEPPFHKQHYDLFPDLDEWVWVDKYIDHPRVKKWDATMLTDFPSDVDHIYASHLLEHFEHTKIKEILTNWHTVLNPGGKLTINVPDLAWAAKQVIKIDNGGIIDGYYHNFKGLLDIFYGSEAHEGEYHKGGFIESYLVEILKEVGFIAVNVRRDFDAHEMGVLIAEGTK